MKRAQFTNPSITIVVVLIAVSVILMGIYSFNMLERYTTESQLNNFVITLNNKLNEFPAKYDEGSVKQFTFSLPKKVDSVCVVDRNHLLNNFVNNELNRQIENFRDENLFLHPYDKFLPYNLLNFKLNASENPLCIKSHGSKISLRFESLGNTTLIEPVNKEEKEVDCVDIIYNGNPDNKIDIVFLGDGYNNVNDFIDDSNSYINNVFMKLEPFNTSMDKFNFYRIDKVNKIQCSTAGYIKCNEFKLKEAASDCPNDYVFVLVDKSKIKELLQIEHLRSSSISNTVSINTADNKLVLAHEFAHAFANLADEYVDEDYYKGFNAEDYPNCDYPECPKWDSLNLGCFQGCSVGNFYRATENSIMRNYYESNELGMLNSKIINRKLEVYS